VLAPTEWNFHPESIAARALAGLSARQDGTEAKVRLLMAALDPCIPFAIDPAATRTEALHA
jgi:hypothetical protein